MLMSKGPITGGLLPRCRCLPNAESWIHRHLMLEMDFPVFACRSLNRETRFHCGQTPRAAVKRRLDAEDRREKFIDYLGARDRRHRNGFEGANLVRVNGDSFGSRPQVR